MIVVFLFSKRNSFFCPFPFSNLTNLRLFPKFVKFGIKQNLFFITLKQRHLKTPVFWKTIDYYFYNKNLFCWKRLNEKRTKRSPLVFKRVKSNSKNNRLIRFQIYHMVPFPKIFLFSLPQTLFVGREKIENGLKNFVF